MERKSNFTYRNIVFSLLLLSVFTLWEVSVQPQLLGTVSESAPLAGMSPKKSNPKISLDVKGMDIVDVLKILADEGGFNFSISGKVTGRITLFLNDIDVWDALMIVLISGDLAYEQKGEVIYIMSEREYELKYGEKYWETRKLKIFNCKHIQVQRLKEMLTQIASRIGKVVVDEPTNTVVVIDIPEKLYQMSDVVNNLDRPLETRIFELNYLPVKTVEEQISGILTKDVSFLKVDEATNKIVVTDYPHKIKEVEKVICAFDEKPLQVLINAKIIEIKPSEKFYAGINWDYWLKKHFRTTGAFSVPTSSTDKFSFGTIGAESVTEKGDYKGIMEFLQIFGETKVLSSPRILVLNNHEAKILVGTKDVYVTSSVSEIGESAVTTQEVNFVDVGVKLYVTPTINRDGYITLKIKPEISSSERERIKTEDKETEVPIVTTSEAETTVIVKEGVSIIIGGLRKIARAKERKQVPLLGDIPGVGVLFRSKKDEWSKNELVIFLTPHIISGDKSIEMELKEKGEEPAGGEEILEEFRNDELKLMEKRDEVQRKKMDTTAREGLNYYSHVVEKIKKAASRFQTDKKAKIKLRFIISKEGAVLKEPEVVSECKDEHLTSLVREIVREASPFAPFPDSKEEEEETFEVLLVF